MLRCFVHSRAILAVTLVAILFFSVTASALAQEDRFSARVLAKGKKSNIMILVANSAKSTSSIHEFKITFTADRPLAAIARGWNVDRTGDSMTFTPIRSDLGPGGKAIFIIKVTDPATSAFEWKVNDNNGVELQSGQVAKIRIREPPKDSILPSTTAPEVNVSKVKASLGEQLTVTGRGYSASSAVIVYIDQTELARITTDASGAFNTVVLIPNNIGVGLHLVKAVDANDKSSVIQILIEGTAGDVAPLVGGKLEVRTDRKEYSTGELIRITGSAVLDSPVSLQVRDPKAGIICGANPQVNSQTLLWDATCPIANNAISGTYVVEAKQLGKIATTTITVKGVTTSGGTGPSGTGGDKVEGEDPGTLVITLDKEKYKVGDVAKITISGARPSSIINFIIDGPGPGQLKAQVLTVNEAGSITVDHPFSAAESAGEWQVTFKQMDAEQKKEFIVRKKFVVEE
jgi:hypothetical protein